MDDRTSTSERKRPTHTRDHVEDAAQGVKSQHTDHGEAYPPWKRERRDALALEAGDAGRDDSDGTNARKAPAARVVVLRQSHGSGRGGMTLGEGRAHRARLGASLVKKAGVKPRTARPGLRGWMRGL